MKHSRKTFAEKFASNFPQIRRTELKISLQIRSAEPRGQNLGHLLTRNYYENNSLTSFRNFEAICCACSIFGKEGLLQINGHEIRSFALTAVMNFLD